MTKVWVTWNKEERQELPVGGTIDLDKRVSVLLTAKREIRLSGSYMCTICMPRQLWKDGKPRVVTRDQWIPSLVIEEGVVFFNIHDNILMIEVTE